MCILIFDDMYHLLLVKTLLFLTFIVLRNGLFTADRVLIQTYGVAYGPNITFEFNWKKYSSETNILR